MLLVGHLELALQVLGVAIKVLVLLPLVIQLALQLTALLHILIERDLHACVHHMHERL